MSRSNAIALAIRSTLLLAAATALLLSTSKQADADSLRDEQGYSCVDYFPDGLCIVPFGFDGVKITPKGRAIINLVLAYATKAQFCSNLAVTGYADRAGPEDYNMALSLRRAEAVRGALVQGGYPSDKITTARLGEMDLIVETPDGVPAAENRRVVILINTACGRPLFVRPKGYVDPGVVY